MKNNEGTKDPEPKSRRFRLRRRKKKPAVDTGPDIKFKWSRHDSEVLTATLPDMLRQLPHIISASLRLAWEASRALTIWTLSLNLVQVVVTTFGLLAATSVFTKLLAQTPTVASVTALAPTILFAVGALAAQNLLRLASSTLASRLGDKTSAAAQEKVLLVASSVPLAAFDNPEFHDALELAMGRGVGTPSAMVRDLNLAAGAVAAIAASATVLAVLQPVLIPLVVLACIPLGWASLRKSRNNYISHNQTIVLRRRKYVISDGLTDRENAPEVRSLGLGRHLLKMWRETQEELLEKDYEQDKKAVKLDLMAGSASAVGLGITYGALLVLLATENIALGAAGGSVLAIRTAKNGITSLVSVINSMYDTGLYYKDYEHFLTRNEMFETESTHAGEKTAAPAPEVIETRGLEFSYPGAEGFALHDINIRVAKGEVIALVGENGSGKTTLSRILGGLYPPTGGSILWDRVDTADYAVSGMRDHIGMVPQEIGRWPFTLMENVTLGRVGSSDLEKAHAAGKDAGLDQVADGLKDGWDSLLTSSFTGGTDLSGGQWQRVALARAFYRDAPVLILDEPTASLDARGEHAVYEKVADLCRDRAVVLISHRLASVRSADRIYVLTHGRITESGNHEELMENGGLYAELFNLQAAAYTEQ